MLFTAKIPLGRLDGHVAQQELNLVQIPSGIAAQARAGPPLMPNAALEKLCRMPDYAESTTLRPRPYWVGRSAMRHSLGYAGPAGGEVRPDPTGLRPSKND